MSWSNSHAELTNNENVQEHADGHSDAALEALRQLLLQPEQEQLQHLQQALRDPRSLRAPLRQALPEVMAELIQRDRVFARLLQDITERNMHNAIAQNPQAFAEIVLPSLRVAVQRLVWSMLSSTLQSINESLENSLNVRWRFEAWRSGRSFAEVVLAHSFVYRVEQVFLIHKHNGLLLTQASLEDIPHQDADLISAMLSAVRDFIQDSFGSHENDGLNVVRMGELTLLIEEGSQAVLAAVVRGVVSEQLQVHLQDMLALIHMQQRQQLRRFVHEGDASGFAVLEPLLQSCLQSTRKSRPKRRFPWPLFGLALLLVLLLGWALGYEWQQRQQWQAYVQRVHSTPGLVISRAQRNWRSQQLEGLRDPLAPDPDAWLAEYGLSAARLQRQWHAYQSLEPSLVLQRARLLLESPDTLELSLSQEVLGVQGVASQAWLQERLPLARSLAGIRALDNRTISSEALRTQAQQLEANTVAFASGTAEFAPGQAGVLATLYETLDDLTALARQADIRLDIAVQGFAGAVGDVSFQQSISQERAEALLALLQAAPQWPQWAEQLRWQVQGLGGIDGASGIRAQLELLWDERWSQP